MKYYILEPEVAGSLGKWTVINRGVHPPDVKTLDYEFDGWLGDVLLESFPCFIATIDAVKELQSLPATGVRFDDVRITKSVQFQEMYPDRVLPTFKWLKVSGQAGIEDMGLAGDLRLVVSDRVLNALKPLGLSNAVIQNFEP
jgi:hypothetical protein